MVAFKKQVEVGFKSQGSGEGASRDGAGLVHDFTNWNAAFIVAL